MSNPNKFAGIANGKARQSHKQSTASPLPSSSSTPKPTALTAPSATPHVDAFLGRRMVEYSSENDKCPVCKYDRYSNPKLRLLVSRCYHKMCESCIDRLFTLGPEPCPQCGTVIRKSGFLPQTFEDLGVEKEIVIRKRLAKSFNKRQTDFKELKYYNDYLEQVEEITFNLINGVDLLETEERIQKFQKENSDLITSNRQSSLREAESIKQREAQDIKSRHLKAQQLRDAEREEELELERSRDQVIAELESTDKSAKRIVKKHAREVAAHQIDTTTSRSTAGYNFAGLISAEDQMGIDEKEQEELDIDGELGRWDDYTTLYDVPADAKAYQDEEMLKITQSALVQAGGYSILPVWNRSIQLALGSLFRPLEA
ncbi:uncharacterized protein L969DRAFT_21815 [Mixia osmundae IAM 14324]|uniref:RNA polymerase II transcription factor B subunit 3 n=1 Tax=Mixia osmundae (strain CBS 9802 / IAM 14324 / JCM 22182 / KY 12970) TaxID=764103 RepID=G7DXQ2_MIXOS|nr:uncharacterized protein L969DRAFT_21815 [Mixia osmundae IAM 14324]KEI41148.1 hypothetical protein L969DRAFT_21815 [Mixia osmundae IAM 14324]GAA95362.1 hypothetical protein E5Q_02019 [Mixia osmundae IAM 14324]